MGLRRAFERRQAHRAESGPEEAVFRFLENTWRTDLRGRPIPKAIRTRMRRDPRFVAMVDHFVASGELATDTGERFAPTCQRDAAGREVSVDRLAALLGDAPEPYWCGCGEEKAPEADACTECREAEEDFQRTGAAPFSRHR